MHGVLIFKGCQYVPALLAHRGITCTVIWGWGFSINQKERSLLLRHVLEVDCCREGKKKETAQSFLPAWRRKRRSKYNTSILRKCKHFCGSPKVQTGSGCLAQIWNSKIILAGIIPQNDSCSDENNICTNSFAIRARSECVCLLAAKEAWKNATRPTDQVRLTLLEDISRLSGKRNSMLTFELQQTCSEVASACKFFVYQASKD